MEALEARPNHLYAKSLHDSYNLLHGIASQARSKGLDPSLRVESETTYDLAERVEKSVGPPGVADRIRELSKLISREETALKISEEIILGRIGSFEEEEAALHAIRTSLAILDEAVTVAPVQGIHQVRIRTNPDRTRHLAIYFAGPMRAAGGTEMGLTLVVGDYVRRKLNLQPYKATDQEARRFVEELRLYERTISRFQYRNPDNVIRDAILRLTVEPNGVETDPVEVAVNRNLPRIETNRVRGGALRVVNDGLLGRSQKILRITAKLGLEGWDWLQTLRTSSAEGEEAKEFMFMEDVVGGRPIFAFPGKIGGFRLRYGRARNTGLASLGLHPATMELLGGFPAVGVQMRTERPGKAGIVTAVDSIEPPVAKLSDGSIVRVDNPHEAKALGGRISRILFLGDILVAFGEFLENNRSLVPSGFVEEWWGQILDARLDELGGELLDNSIPDRDRLTSLAQNPLTARPSASEALAISRILQIPLHPYYTWFWENVSLDEIQYLRHKLAQYINGSPGIIRLARDSKLETIFEKLCLPCGVSDGNLQLPEEESLVLAQLLRPSDTEAAIPESSSVLSALSKLAGFPLEQKSRSYVGARMGRPEKAKERIMTPKVHALFPAGQPGGPKRDIIEAAKKAISTLDLIDRICPACERWEPHLTCTTCGGKTEDRERCPRCAHPGHGTCRTCSIPTVFYRSVNIDLQKVLEESLKRLGLPKPPEIVKGVKGLTNKTRIPESLEKGVLRAKWDVSVFKDGTLRYDATNAVLTHFKPGEIGLSLDKASALGYVEDVENRPLTSANQLCQMEIQDLVIPEGCGDYFVKVSKFIDDLLQLHYGLERFYNAKTRDNLIGHLVVGLSPHTSVGVVGRIIGFTKASVCYAHPLFHAAKRRDCDGDEDSLCLLLDVMLNFSREFLPDRIGGLMDAPLLLAPLLNPVEVARQAFNVEVEEKLPLKFYEKTLEAVSPKEVEDLVPTLNRSLASPNGHWKIGYTHPVEDLDSGKLSSSYKELPTMLDKVKAQLDLAEKTGAVRGEEVARKVLSTHILRDLVGNLRTFTSQHARCMKCNFKPRRPPLGGVCRRCGGKLGATVFRSGVEKYLDVASDMVEKYAVGDYLKERLELVKLELEETFKTIPVDREQQKLLVGDFA